MLRGFTNRVIWSYAEDVPIDRLWRHYRIACWINRIAWGSGLLMTTSLAGLLASREGWLRTFDMLVMITSGIVTLLAFIPGLCAGLWANDIQGILKARGLPLPDGGVTTDRIPRTAMKMCYWAVVIVVIASVVDR